MTIELNLDRLDDRPTVPGGDKDGRVQDPSLYGAITGHIASGRYLLQIGDPCGATVREASRAELAHIRPRPTPVLLRPRLIRSLFDRRTEIAAALSALDAGLPIEVSGDAGIGKTAVLRHLAHHPRTASFVDGIVYLQARHQAPGDLLQLIFEAFYESDQICKPTEAEIRRSLQDKQALILLDDVQLGQDELERVLDVAPRSAFAISTGERCLWAEVRGLALAGLPVEDAVRLLEREIERSLDVSEREAAASLCASLDGHPLRILQAAAILRERPITLDECARIIAAGGLAGELMASIDKKQRRALLALASLPGVPLQAQDIAGIAEVTDIESSLMALARRGLVVSGQSRHRAAAGVGDQLRRTEDLKPWVNRAITYFTAWAERYRRISGTLLAESETLVSVQQCAADTRRFGEVLRVGRLLEGVLVLGARWGAWGLVLEQCLAAARALGDREAEAWALHEAGTRALCLGEPGPARASLSQAVKLREAAGHQPGIAASRANLGLVLVPVPEAPAKRTSMLVDDLLGLNPLSLRRAGPPARMRKKNRGSGVMAAAVVLALLGGLAYWALAANPAWAPWNLTPSAPSLAQGGGGTPPSPPAAPQHLDEPPGRQVKESPGQQDETEVLTPSAPASDKASILIFTSRPGPFARRGPTNLCYAVSGALHVRLEPGVGKVNPTSTLSCVPVAPARTTTYELTAYGRDGDETRQQLVIFVR